MHFADRQRRAADSDALILTDPHINVLYESVIECTEEAVLNAMVYSGGQMGRLGRIAPAFPAGQAVDLLAATVTRRGPRAF
jgi:L-aminopeptidase/D-esterase-like protein